MQPKQYKASTDYSSFSLMSFGPVVHKHHCHRSHWLEMPLPYKPPSVVRWWVWKRGGTSTLFLNRVAMGSGNTWDCCSNQVPGREGIQRAPLVCVCKCMQACHTVNTQGRGPEAATQQLSACIAPQCNIFSVKKVHGQYLHLSHSYQSQAHR